jgi:uncharacterized protein (TIGR01244 family)
MQTSPNRPTTERIDDGVFVCAQLTPADMPALAAAGFRAVINNRPDSEGGASQPTSAELEAAATAAGLSYSHLPVPPAGHSTDDGRRMAELVARLPKPLVAFCRSGRRSQALYRLGRD